MSIIIQFSPSSVLPSVSVPPVPGCVIETETALEMGPEQKLDSNVATLSQDENSFIELSAPHVLYSHSEDTVIASSNSYRVDNCAGLPYQDHNYGAPPPPSPPRSISPRLSPLRIKNTPEKEFICDDVSVSVNSEEVAEGSVTRCVCGFDHDDEYMICCDRCLVWQHVDCMGLDRNNIPETYLCEKCEPRKVDKQKAKFLQARKKVAMTDTSDSDEENANKNVTHSPRAVRNSKRKKESEKSDSTNDHVSPKGSKTHSKHEKGRMEAKRSKLRRRNKSKSEATTAADEEAQDAWESSLERHEKNLENVTTNQYTAEVQLLVGTLSKQGNEQEISQQLQNKLCEVVDSAESTKRLISTCDISRNQVIIEYKGKYMLTSQLFEKNPMFNKRFFPFILFHQLTPDQNICVDATEYGNEARFIGKSSVPNCEVRSVVLNGVLHLYISSIKNIKKAEEITIHQDFQFPESYERRKRIKKHSASYDDDSNHSQSGSLSSPIKSSKKSPVKSNSSVSSHQASSQISSSVENSKAISDEHDGDEQITEQKRKLTREERKIDAIMRAFDQMEKAAKRRQQALDRLAQQRTQQQQSDEQVQKHEHKQESSVLPIKEEEDKQNISVTAETTVTSEEKPSTPGHSAKHKKGKRRRGSGTPARRRTRTNSGGSDVFIVDETSVSETSTQNLTPLSTEATPAVSVTALPTVQPVLSPVPSATPVLPKTKRFLLHEWMQEKSETNGNPSSSASLHTEMSWSMSTATPTCYVRCTKDSPSSGGISAAHLRRISSSGHCKHTAGQVFAKKRWLRQAMHDCGSCSLDRTAPEINNCISSPHRTNSTSPNSLSEISNSDVSPPDDVVTPLKKRRLMRESVDSISSPKSPAAHGEWLGASSGTSPDHSSSEPIESDFQQQSSGKTLHFENNVSDENAKHFSKMCDGNGISMHILKSMRKNWIKRENKGEFKNYEIKTDPGSVNITRDLINSGSSVDSGLENSDITKCDDDHVKNKINSSSEYSLCKTANFKHTHVNRVLSSGNQSIDHVSSYCKYESLCTNLITLVKVETKDDNSERKSCLTKTDSCSSVMDTVLPINEPASKGTSSEEYSSNNTQDSVSSIVTDELCLDKTDVPCSAEEEKRSKSDQVVNGKLESTTCQSNENSFVADSSLTVTCEDKSFTDSHPTTNSQFLGCFDVQITNIQESPVKKCNVIKSTSVSGAQSYETNDTGLLFSKSILPQTNDEIHYSNVNGDSDADCGDIKSTSKVLQDIVQLSESAACVTNSDTSSSDDKSVTLTSSCAAVDVKSCESAAKKRKVSLSEYRKRKQEGSSTSVDGEKKTSCTTSALVLPEPDLEKGITLAALPLFENVNGEQSQKLPEKGSEADSLTNSQNANEVKPRENLAERLKREFGLDDDDDDDRGTDEKSKGLKCPSPQDTAKVRTLQNVTYLPICTQLPPPPPPPINHISSSDIPLPKQLNYSVSQAYIPQPFIVAQVSAKCVSAQSTLPPQIVPVLHSVSVQNTSHSLMPSTHSYTASVHAAVSGRAQTNYSCSGKQGFATLIQQPLLPSSKSTYHHDFKNTLFK